MCGASDSQNELSAEQTQFYKQIQQQDQTTFGEDQGILKQVTDAYAPILAAGPNQYGFSAAETNNLNTSATEGVATDYASAAKALRETNAAMGGGDTYLSSGVKDQQEAQLATSAAQQESSDKLQVNEAGYQQGYDQFKTATSALSGIEGENESTTIAANANQAGEAAGTTDNQINEANNSWYAPLVGAAAAVGSAGVAAKFGN